VDWATVAHPQTNDQVECANSMILQGLKHRIFNKLNKFGRKWVQELPSVIWSLRTTSSRATGFTPFFLVYSAEAILPTDLGYWSPRLKAYQESQNQRAREDSLDQVDEARDVVMLHSARYQQSLRRYRAQKVQHQDFSEGNLVLSYDKTTGVDTSSRHHGKGPTSSLKCSSLAHTSSPTRRVKSSPMPSTYNNYVTSTLRFLSFLCTFHT
jgi:hypothetical protein